MAQQARSTFLSTSVHNFLPTNKQLMTNTNIRLPYLEDTGIDEKKLYSPKELTERFRHYKKRMYNLDIKHILTNDTVPTGNPWDKKEPEIR